MPVWQSLWGLSELGSSQVPATNPESPPNECATWPTHGGHQRMVWASKIDLTPLHYCQVTLSQTWTPVQVGSSLGVSQVLGYLFPGLQPRASGLQALPSGVVREVCFTSVSLESSKVACLLGLTGLGKAVHLSAGSSGWSTSEGIWPLWLLLYLPLLEHPLLLDHWQLPNYPQIPCHPWEMEQLSCSMCPSSMAAMASTQQWASLVTLKDSSQDSCSLSKKWPKWS